jgi:hypothetical protein
VWACQHPTERPVNHGDLELSTISTSVTRPTMPPRYRWRDQ